MIQLESSQIGGCNWPIYHPYILPGWITMNSLTSLEWWFDCRESSPNGIWEQLFAGWWILIIQPNGFFGQKTLWFCEKWVVCSQTKWWVCGNYVIFHLQKWLMLWNLWNISPPKMVDVPKKWWCCGKWRGMCALLGSTQPWSVWRRPTTSLNLRTAGSLHKSSHKVVPSL